jgi:hypothetical protein
MEMNKKIIIDYEEYLVLEHINKIHKNEMNKLRNCVVISDKEYEQLQQENNKLKEQRQELKSWLEEMIDDENDIFSVVRVRDILIMLNELEGKNE